MLSTNFAILTALWVGLPDVSLVRLKVEPTVGRLRGSDSRIQILATGYPRSGRLVDLTSSAQYRSENPNVALVDANGQIRPMGDGSSTIEVSTEGLSATIAVRVHDFADFQPVQFVNEVVPILTKFGCNAGGCHGKASGQNGFKLSLLGSDPKMDFDSIAREGRGRRVFPTNPDASLFLRKPSGRVPHGGGRRFEAGSPEYRTFARWVGQGLPFAGTDESELLGLAVEPSSRVVSQQGLQQLRVVARYSDGITADVTRLAQYQSNSPDLADVDTKGGIRTLVGVGDATIMARFGGLVGIARVTIPSDIPGLKWDGPPSRSLVDPLAYRKWKELGLVPSEACTDAEFARRSSLDVCGVLPEPAEVIAFEQDPDPWKRTRWVDRLIARPEYADFFAMKWSAILKNKRVLGDLSKPGTFAFHGWIRQSLAENKPYDRFVGEILGAKGDVLANPPVAWYQQVAKLEDRADDSAQLLLGVRVRCARCHHHPSERWSQDDYYGFASIFARIGTKSGAEPTSPRIFNLSQGLATNPMTGEARKPKPLGGAEFGPSSDPRLSLVDWLKRPDNPFFARAVVNRYWKHFLGRGMVELEDDFRVSNPPTNPELLDALATEFVHHGYDLKWLVREIATSRVYDRSSVPNAWNEGDRRNFARFSPRRLPAEVMLDAINLVIGSRESFPGLPERFSAVQLPDDGFDSEFLDVFGRPRRESACECERSSEANLSQTLLLLNSEEIHTKLVADSSRPALLANDLRPDFEKIAELYRLAFAREPTSNELADCLAFLEKRRPAGRLREGYEDLLWTLINTKEFLFNH